MLWLFWPHRSPKRPFTLTSRAKDSLPATLQYSDQRRPTPHHYIRDQVFKCLVIWKTSNSNHHRFPGTAIIGVSILSSAPQLLGNSQVCLTHYKRGCLPPPLSLALAHFSFSLPSLSPFLSPLSMCSWPTSTPLRSLSLFLTLCLSLNSPCHALNKLYSILYCHVAGTSGGRDASAWTGRGTPFPPPFRSSTKHIPGFSLLSFFL